MTRSIRKGQKRLRKKAKPHDNHAQSPGYWRREVSNRLKAIDEKLDQLCRPKLAGWLTQDDECT